jgi:ribosomal protein S18 acetylase RimI-like enzyme
MAIDAPPTPSAIRIAGIADAPGISRLLWAARDAIPLRSTLDQAQFLQWHHDHCAAGTYLVIDQDGGIAAAMLLLREQIYYLVVAEQARRHRLGSALIDRAKVAFARLDAKVSPDNLAIQALLRGAQFRLVGTNGSWLDYEWP